VTRADREIQQNGDKIMYIKNKVNLIGFLGSDAEVRTANNCSFTTLSLATKSSYKDKKSNQYVSQQSGTVASSLATSPNSPER
jgi:single-strand DNA-binding protein